MMAAHIPNDADPRSRNTSQMNHTTSNSSHSASPSNTDHQQQPVTYRNAREYAQALRPWLWQYQNYCAMQQFAANFALQMQTMSMLSNTVNNNYCSPLTNNYLRQRPDPYASRRPQAAANGQPHIPQEQRQQQGAPAQAPDFQGVVMKIPTFWKRVAAELIDFTFLFYIKMIVSLFLMTEVSLDHISFLSSDDLFDSFNDLDYDRAFAITFEVIALEIINRVLITIFETMCLYRTIGDGVAIGATPGKRLMGLRVVSCDQVRSIGYGQVLVSPAGNISLKNAFMRSVIKNFTIAFFLPACLTLFFFKHNRAAYDVIAHTIVVESM